MPHIPQPPHHPTRKAVQYTVRIVPAENGLEEAADRLRRGMLVAFPTETVYGLGANALDAEAVARIFAAKGRPSTNPLIVHVPDLESARELAAAWPEMAERLAQAFWPGPLTMVVPRSSAIPDNVTAGGETVGLRVPGHPIARALLEQARVPVAAPSANRSEEVSPTTAAHVAESLGPYAVDLLILDGGPCAVGIESTVVDVTGTVPRILRPGRVTAEEIRAVAGAVTVGQAESGPARSPGLRARHYAPRKPVILLEEALSEVAPGDTLLHLPDDPHAAATLLYAELRRLDTDPSIHRILVIPFPNTSEWIAVRDRLRRAAVPAEDVSSTSSAADS